MMKKIKHNKKRNTGFLFEVLVNEMTKALIENNIERKEAISKILSTYFTSNALLRKELELYQMLMETVNLDLHTSEKLLFEVKKEYSKIDKDKIFQEQTALIKQINSTLSSSVFSNFLPNYKSLASISQMFNDKTPIKRRVILESMVVKSLMRQNIKSKQNDIVPIDNIVYSKFVENFNNKYGSLLLSEQKELLSKYISSFADNGLELKIFLNEEVGRLKQCLIESLKMKEIKEDVEMLNKAKKVISSIDEFKELKINETMIQKILKIQNLVKEISD